jgi:hypothetical protein
VRGVDGAQALIFIYTSMPPMTGRAFTMMETATNRNSAQLGTNYSRFALLMSQILEESFPKSFMVTGDPQFNVGTKKGELKLIPFPGNTRT